MTNTKFAHIALFALCLAVISTQIIRHYEPYTFIFADNGWQVLTVKSLVEDADLDLRNQLGGDPVGAADQIALGSNGAWYCVHEFLLPILTVPFYLLFGLNGCLVFNILLYIGAIFAVVRILFGSFSPLVAVYTTLLLVSQTIWCAYSYSLDILGLYFIVSAFERALARSWKTAGLLFGLAVFGRVINLVTFPAFFYLAIVDDRQALRNFILYSLPAGLVLLASNAFMFGGPFQLSYFHNAYLTDGALRVISQSSRFTQDPLVGLFSILFDPTKGMLFCYPILSLGLLLGYRSWWQRDRRSAIAMALFTTTFLGFYSFYTGAIELGGGMRHFLPVLFLCAISLAHLLNSDFCSSKEPSSD